MTQSSIGRLQRVALREVWKHEAQNFTQWLEGNIDVLNEALDLNLLSADRERSAGDFSVDLVAVFGRRTPRAWKAGNEKWAANETKRTLDPNFVQPAYKLRLKNSIVPGLVALRFHLGGRRSDR